jgi:putative heme iron utilization protein
MNTHISADGRPVDIKPTGEKFSPVAAARRVLRRTDAGALATLGSDHEPFASLVIVAATAEGNPLLLLSDIAVHSANIRRDRRVSLLLVEPGGEAGDPLAGARLTLTGEIGEDDDEGHRRRFLARHPEATGYSRFRDFRLYRLDLKSAHLVAGFGRIVDFAASELLIDCSDSAELIANEQSAVDHMNKDHREALSLYATRLLGQQDGDWRMTGADPEGIDMRADDRRARLVFPEKVRSGGALRATLVHLFKEARVANAIADRSV